MKVLLIDADSKKGNPAIMKISMYHKLKGDEVFLKRGLGPDLPLDCFNPEKAYLSCIFSRNRERALKLSEAFPCPVEIGGYGVNNRQLPDEIEHLMPDYDLYGIDYSMGFSSRGCFRNCPWCLVPKTTGPFREHAEFTEFLHPGHGKLILLDDNFLFSKLWKEKLNFLIENGIKVNISQGLDIRLINEDNARILADLDFWSLNFKRRYLYFSFDLPDIENHVRKGVEILNKAGIKSTYLVFYMLTGFSTSFEEDKHRFNVLRELGVRPFVMVYNNKKDPLLRAFARYVNRPAIYKSCSWEEYTCK